MLTSIAENLWTCPVPLRFMGLQLGTRMNVVRLASGDLWVHSPVELTEALRREVDALGPLRSLVAPNKLHHLYLEPWARAYPDAVVSVAPGLTEKRKDLTVQAVLGNDPDSRWSPDLGQTLIEGAPLWNEVVFVHRPSRTLIVTDLVIHLRQSDSWLTRAYLKLNGIYGRLGCSYVIRTMVRDRAAARASLDRVLAWEFDRILPCHGEPVESGGRQALREAYAWL